LIDIHKRRHREWTQHEVRWRWLVDSLEGGDQYRFASYGTDGRGYPARNLVRHKREYDDAERNMFGDGGGVVRTTDNDYDLRLVRTPVPTMVAEVVNKHLSRIYAKEVKRDENAQLQAWRENVDGAGTTIDDWMQAEVAPLLYTLGTLDVLIEHPAAPDGQRPASLAEQQQMGLDTAVAKVVLPQNVVDWELNPDRTYAWAVVREVVSDPKDPAKELEQFRRWTDTDWTLHDKEGLVLAAGPHPFGRVPMVRLMLDRKALCENVGRTPIEAVAERAREYYNRDSELILNDTQQAHPLLQGPEDYIGADGTIPIGPSWLLPKKKNTVGTSTAYEGFEIVDFPKDGADSIRQNKANLRDEVDRLTANAKPAGETGSGANTVAQSGVSKAFDQSDLVNLLSRLAAQLERAERQIAVLALTVLTDGAEVDATEIEITYPRQFSVYGAEELASMLADFQSSLREAGSAPEVETRALGLMVRVMLPGLNDDVIKTIDDEIAAAVGEQSERKRREQEAAVQAAEMMSQGELNVPPQP
jgi:hypothetical protein